MSIRKLVLSSVALLVLFTSILYSAPFYNDNFVINTKKYGDIVCTQFGDEFQSYIEDPNGFVVVWSTEYQTYMYAISDADGYLVPSSVPIGGSPPAGKHLRITGSAIIDYNQRVADWSTSLDDTPTVDDDNLAVILFDFLADTTDTTIYKYNGGTYDFGTAEYYDIELMYNSFFAEGYNGQTGAYETNPSDKENSPNEIFDVYGSVRQYFREISYYDTPMSDTSSCSRDDFDMAPPNVHPLLPSRNYLTASRPLDESRMYYVPGFLNPVVYDDDVDQWHFLYYNLGATIHDPEIDDDVPATAENVQDIVRWAPKAMNEALRQADSLGFSVEISADTSYNVDVENKIHMMYAGESVKWASGNYGRYSWAQEEKLLDIPGETDPFLIFDHIYYHSREIGQNIFKLADTGHNHYKWDDGSPTDLYAHFNWGIGPYDIMNGHLFTTEHDAAPSDLEKFNSHAFPPHPSPANKVLKDIIDPIVISDIDDTLAITPYTTTGMVYLVEDPSHPVNPSINYADAEYFLLCNRSLIGTTTVDTQSFEKRWPFAYRALDIYHVDWSDEDPDRRKAYQAETDHREIYNVLADNIEGEDGGRLDYFHYFYNDLFDMYWNGVILESPRSDWNDGGQNGGGPSFITLTPVITTTSVSFGISSIQDTPYFISDLKVPEIAGGLEDPNLYLGTNMSYKPYELWIKNYSDITASHLIYNVSVDDDYTDIADIENGTQAGYTFSPIQPDSSVLHEPLNIRMTSTNEGLVGSEITFSVDYGGHDGEDEINLPVSHTPDIDFPITVNTNRRCVGNLLAFDIDKDGVDEFIGFANKDLCVFKGDQIYSIEVDNQPFYPGIAIGNILPDSLTNTPPTASPQYGVDYEPEILVLYNKPLQNTTYVKIYRFDNGLELAIPPQTETGAGLGKLTAPVLGDLKHNNVHDLVYCNSIGGVKARTFASGEMETIWNFLPENGVCEALPYQKPLIADLTCDGQKEVAVCVYSEGPNGEFLGDGYRVIKTNELATSGYTEIPVEPVINDNDDATKGYRITGVAADFDGDDTLEIACQWGHWGIDNPITTTRKLGILEYEDGEFRRYSNMAGAENNFSFNGEMIVADVDPLDNDVEIIAGTGSYIDPSLIPENRLISFSYSSHTITKTSHMNWNNENGSPFTFVARGFSSTDANTAGIIKGEDGEYSQIHVLAPNGDPFLGSLYDNTTQIASGQKIVFDYSNTIPNAAIAFSDNKGVNDQSLFVWTDRFVNKFTRAGISSTTNICYWPMKYHDAQNTCVYDTVAAPDSIVFSNGITLSGIYFFKEATVSEGDTVYIAPGASIFMTSDDPDDRFHVYGTLIAEGTAEDSISFIGVDNDTTGGILFHDTCLPNSKLQHIGFYDFKYALEFDGYVETSWSREINNLHFTDCQYGLYANYSSIVADNLEFTDCSNSLRAIETHVILDTCKISNPGVYGIYLQGNSAGTTDTYSYLYNIEIDGDGSTSCFATIYAFYLTQCIIEDLRIEDAFVHGIYTGYSSGAIRDAFILSSGNTGLICFNSVINLDGVVINDSEQYGILTYGTTSPVLNNCAIVNNDNIQYYSTSTYLPVLRYNHNDIYREAGNTNYLIRNTGTLQNAIFRCEYNYWGTTAPDYTLFNVNRRIVDYSPWDTAPNVPTISTAETDTFMLACDAELEGDWDLAKERFQWIIQNSPEETQRMEALAHWVNLGSTSIDTWEEKENQLNTWESTAVIGTEFYNSLEDAMARCYVGQKRHYDAIEIYSNRYHNATTFSDSALAEIHINNIYVDMAYSFNGEGGRSTSNADVSIEDREELKPQLGSIRAVHNTNKLKPSSLTKAEKRVRKLMDLIASGKREETSLLPKEFKLASPYPNPFNPTVAIPFEIPKQAEISIAVYNILGQRVSTLVNKPMNAGYHKILWNGKDQYGTPIASGVYFVKMSAPNYIKTRKIVMLK